MIIAVRHGETEMNDGAGGNERTRGWLPVPLTVAGMNQMMDTADSLSDIEDVQAIYCSDLVRAIQSAEEVAHVLGMAIHPTPDLRDWNIGEFAGQEVKKILKDLHGFMHKPEKAIPGGEPYQSFLNRCIPFLKNLVETSDVNLVVTHNRVMTLIDALCENQGEYPEMDILLDKGPVPPSGIMIIDKSWNVVFKSEKNA